MQKGLKFRIYPNKEQEIMIRKTLGCARLVYNRFLDERIKAYQEGNSIGYNTTSSMLTHLKKTEEYSFLKEVDAVALQQSLRDLDQAYKNFFSKKSRFPRFKSKHNHNQSYRTQNTSNGTSIQIKGNKVKLPKLGWVKIKLSRPVGKITNATVRMTPSGKFFVSLLCECEDNFQMRSGDGQAGLDVGLKSFYTDSNGNSVVNPRYLEKNLKKLVREQRRLSRKVKGSNNREKQRIKVARVHEKITNMRNDFLQKESTKLVKENQIIGIEDLNVKEMMKNHRLAKSISSVSWGEFFRMLDYKCAWYGSSLIKIDRFYPSSQVCSMCGYQNPDIKDLSIREWACPQCDSHHDRDINAAKNILSQALTYIN